MAEAAPPSPNKGDILTLDCERMSYGPNAIAHAEDGRTVFVSNAVAGDVVRACVVQPGGSFLKARATDVITPSPRRVDSPCPYSEACGGCPWAHLSYGAQLEAKRANVVDALSRIGRFGRERAEALVKPCEAPGKPWGYRNKVELAASYRGTSLRLGMHDTAGAGIVETKSCALLDHGHKKLVKSVSGALAYLGGSKRLGIERVGIRVSRRTGDVEVALWDSPGPFPRAHVAKVLKDATNASSVVRVLTKGARGARRVSSVERLSGKGFWTEQVAGSRMALSAPSFFQVNTAGAEKLVSLVLEGLDVGENDVAMDLYAGAGTFTLPLAERAAWVSAVESYGPAVRDLRRNLEHAGAGTVEVIGGDAGREFPDVEVDVIVVDPPRAGLAKDVVEKLSAQPARAIAYVSCDPATLARDLARFEQAGTFTPVSVTPVDLFPQTFHVECVTLLLKTKQGA